MQVWSTQTVRLVVRETDTETEMVRSRVWSPDQQENAESPENSWRPNVTPDMWTRSGLAGKRVSEVLKSRSFPDAPLTSEALNCRSQGDPPIGPTWARCAPGLGKSVTFEKSRFPLPVLSLQIVVALPMVSVASICLTRLLSSTRYTVANSVNSCQR